MTFIVYDRPNLMLFAVLVRDLSVLLGEFFLFLLCAFDCCFCLGNLLAEELAFPCKIRVLLAELLLFTR